MATSTIVILTLVGMAAFLGLAVFLQKKLTKFSFTWKQGPTPPPDGK